jgi:hypothetical protein
MKLFAIPRAWRGTWRKSLAGPVFVVNLSRLKMQCVSIEYSLLAGASTQLEQITRGGFSLFCKICKAPIGCFKMVFI